MARNELQEVGQKCRAERMVSEYIRAIGNEVTEVTTVFKDPDTGEVRLVSKAEMLARDIWDKALYGKKVYEGSIAVPLDEKLVLEYRKLILDRIEGRPVATGEEGPKRRDIPDKPSKKGVQRLNKLAKETEK